MKCDVPLNSLKTGSKTIYTMPVGKIFAKDFYLRCPCCKEIFRSQELAKLVPFRCQYGFDVIVWIGKALFLEGKGEGQVQTELKARNINISSSEIAYLAKKFVAYVAIAHQESAPDLRKLMSGNGGYILHFDGTVDGDSPHLVTGLDGISNIVLGAAKTKSEKAEYIKPFFEEIKRQYGVPIALVSDMAWGPLAAIQKVFPGVPDFICHYHFLRDIGKDLFEKEYRQLKSRIATLKVRNLLQVKARCLTETKKMANGDALAADLMASLKEGTIETEHLREFPWVVTYVLIRWALDTRFDLDGYGFPFDQHHYAFYCRLKTVHLVLKKIMNVHISRNWKDNRPICRIKVFLDKVFDDPELVKAANTLEKRIAVFNKLRKAMRIAEPNGDNGLNDDGNSDIKTIETKVTEFRKEMAPYLHSKNQLVYRKMIKQLDANWEKLFTDPIVVSTPKGELTIQPQRTNNILERFFRDIRRNHRKRTGKKSMNKALKAMLAETPLVKNLENDDYIKVLLNGAETLEQRFAQIDAKLVRQILAEAEANKEKLSPTIKKIVFRESLPQEIISMFKKWSEAS